MMRSAPEIELTSLLAESIASAKEREASSFNEMARPFQNAIVLFGAGLLGKKIFEGLKRERVEVLAFSDNDPSKWGQTFKGLPILPPDIAANKFGKKACFVITVFSLEGQYYTIERQLLKLGCLKISPYLPLFWKYPKIFPADYLFCLPHEYIEQCTDIMKVFSLLGNEDSRRQFVSHVRFRLLSDFNGLPKPSLADHYFNSEIISLSSEEVFVDCGAYDGSTIRNFLKFANKNFKKIIAYEPDPSNFESLSQYRLSLDRRTGEKISLRQSATGSEKKRVRFDWAASEISAVSEQGAIIVDNTALDDELMFEKPTFIKLDVEGAELDTLVGAQKILNIYNPILAVSAYHKPRDIWELCLYLNSCCNGKYMFYFMTHGSGGIDTVLYAIPYERRK